MGNLIALDRLISSRQVWRGQSPHLAASAQPTGHAALDAALPIGGWPEAALSELLLPSHGVGELELMWPALARLSQAQAGGMIVLVDPPYLPYPAAWRDAGVALPRLQIVRARQRDALWAAEQCLRSGACTAVLCWPQRADDRVLRRLQVAAETGQSLGFVLRDMAAARNPSPAALRIAIDTSPRQLRVLKCRGGNAPSRPIAFAHPTHAPHAADALARDSIASDSITIHSIITSTVGSSTVGTSKIDTGSLAPTSIASGSTTTGSLATGSMTNEAAPGDSIRIGANALERNRLALIATPRNEHPHDETQTAARAPAHSTGRDDDDRSDDRRGDDERLHDPARASSPPLRAAPALTLLRPR